MKFNIPPISKQAILPAEELVKILSQLIGREFVMTFKPRTDGSRLRKLIESTIEGSTTNATPETYQIMPLKKKGLPRLLSELIDTYVVSSGESYNLQVWNRNPNGKNTLIKYSNGETITPKDIRLVMAKISLTENKISSITILTPGYIEKKFGKFGKPTIKNQLLINPNTRSVIISSDPPIRFYDDTQKVKEFCNNDVITKGLSFTSSPTKDKLIPLSVIKDKVALNLIGRSLDAADTKNRGQQLERLVIELLGYDPEDNLMGGFPDIPNQLLEVKVQDAQTIDLGKYSPQFIETIDHTLNLTTEDVRYLIALTDPKTHVICGVILSSGEALGKNFTFVNGTSYKCQRSIPMKFFDNLDGKCSFNP